MKGVRLVNIGCVIYKKNFEKGSLDADWHFEINRKQVNGTGKAIGNPGNSYAGEYRITYFNEKDEDIGTFDLHIKKENDFYTLNWFNNNELKYVGTGMIYNNSLIAGWKNNQ